LPKVAKECPESHEDSQGKVRRKNKHSVCIYIWLPLGGEVAKEKKQKNELLPSPSPPMYITSLMAGCQRLPTNVQRIMKIPREKAGGKTNIVCVYTLGERWPRKGSHCFFF